MVGSNQVRVNGGVLRGRLLSFSEKVVRPTKATVRKTLFNWLRPVIAGKSCLDCFCGSGVLAFEAISEGAGYALCLDQSSRVVSDVQENVVSSGLAGKIEVSQACYPWDVVFQRKFDIVFIDPPFDKVDINDCLYELARRSCMRMGCLIYIECRKGVQIQQVRWLSELKRSRSAGVDFYLLVYKEGFGE